MRRDRTIAESGNGCCACPVVITRQSSRGTRSLVVSYEHVSTGDGDGDIFCGS